ncbi:uncharacterized protein LOC130686094 isoform X1 [Daphnia carinata]|uniref:uncharacterized protein LOC130686094 isoform X1 n=1 Tax=Daphnia carinata TaxID=120202 RepID=UPI00257A0DB3|nr:uncharacterized protein LOC130686094 isoform X1 [Daphnia carinata]XP_057365370.1 uncharacterized protein LOC130686094 isoform X1 [Daphnia carinata]
MQQARTARLSTHRDTLASLSSASTSQNGKKRKNSQGQNQQVVGKISNKKIKFEGNSVADDFSDEEQAPWANFQSFSPRKMSWMLQKTFAESRENRRMINEMQEAARVRESAEDYHAEFSDCWNYAPKSKQLPRYPLFTMDSLEEVEEELSSEPNAGLRLMNYELLLLPHPDAQQFLFNILNFLLHSDLATEFTYTGKVTQNSFKSLHLCEVIKKTVRKKFPNTEEAFFADRIANWLSRCKKKYAKRSNKQNKQF